MKTSTTTQTCVCVLLAVMAIFRATAGAQTEPPASAATFARTAQPATQPAATQSATATQRKGIVPYQPGVQIDWTNKQVLLAGQVVLREGDLELFACSPNTKEHESIVRLQARPMHVFQAMGLVGLEPGKPPLYDNKAKRVVPATGQPLDITVRWTAAGQAWSVPIWQWLWDKKQNQPAGPITWVFAGSMFTDEGYLLADLDGTVITVVDFESAVIAIPASHTSANEDLWLRAYTEKIPSADTTVTVIIQAASTPLVFRMDRLGRLHLGGRPSTLRDAMQAAQEAGRKGVRAATVYHDPQVPQTQLQQLVIALMQVGLSEVKTQAEQPAVPAGSQPSTATQGSSARSTFEEQGLAVLQALSDLGRQLPSAADGLARSVKDRYVQLNERATAASHAISSVARVIEAMQGASEAESQPGQ